MDAITFYRIIFVGNEPYKNRSEILNNRMKRKINVIVYGDDHSKKLMLDDLVESMIYYVRKFMSGVFKI